VAKVESRASRARESTRKRMSSTLSAQVKRTPNFSEVSRTLSKNLKLARRRRRLSVRVLAARARVSTKVIEAIEAGKRLRSLSLAAIERMAKALRMRTADLLDTDG
jgi:ribosome-binding protein aMBF1 (putative translation factor)